MFDLELSNKEFWQDVEEYRLSLNILGRTKKMRTKKKHLKRLYTIKDKMIKQNEVLDEANKFIKEVTDVFFRPWTRIIDSLCEGFQRYY